MYKFSRTSLDRLLTCHPDLVLLMLYAIRTSPVDMTIVCGHRGEEDQNRAYDAGFSTLRYPQSKHNNSPSLAVDVAPYRDGIEWNDEKLWKELLDHIRDCAEFLGVKVKFGADWKTFVDKPHVELG